jgi:hypothetical protein
MMSSEPIVGHKRSAPHAPDTSDDDGSQPERGNEAEAAGPKLDQAERQRNKKLMRDGEARTDDLSREQRKMTAIMRQIEEMEHKEKAVKAGPCFTQLAKLRAGSGMETRKWVGSVGFATSAMLGAREQDRGCAEREVGRGARSLKTRERRRPSTRRAASTAKAKRTLWRRESVPCPRKATRPKSSSMKKEWAVVGQAVKLRRKSAQNARTTAKTANVGNARDQARASIAES